MNSKIVAGNRFGAIVGGQTAVHRRLNRVVDEANSAVTEEKIAATRMQAAKAAYVVGAITVVAQRIVAEDGWSRGLAVHRLVTGIGRKAVLCRHREHGAIPRVARIGQAGSAPRLFQPN